LHVCSESNSAEPLHGSINRATQLREQDRMRTSLRIDRANCPSCFNDTVDQLEHVDGVLAVHGSMAGGTIEIDHDDHVDLGVLVAVVRDHLHGIEMFANEVRMVPIEPSVTPQFCGHAS
jgi:copper chaperone CopZ